MREARSALALGGVLAVAACQSGGEAPAPAPRPAGPVAHEVPATAPPPVARETRSAEGGVRSVPVAVTLLDPRAEDQDDLCVWVHPTDPSASTVIVSDKSAGRIFVYDLSGKALQSLEVPKPGNVDVRRGVRLGGRERDIVAWNQREGGYRIVVCEVDLATRKLRRLDDGGIETSENYGGCLYASRSSGRLYFFITSKPGHVEQYELADNGKGGVAGRRVRRWEIGSQCEGAVADDESDVVYVADEDHGVWALGADPELLAVVELVVRLGEDGLVGDVEGLALWPRPGGSGYLVVSNQKANDFRVYRRSSPHGFVGAFSVAGARKTDGLDLTPLPAGPAFPRGAFACHSGASKPCPVLLARLEDVEKALGIGSGG
ncbi:MAG: phytase [Planctomycetales bacterium]|nr:phytase [Planctomycetales bacterium]